MPCALHDSLANRGELIPPNLLAYQWSFGFMLLFYLPMAGYKYPKWLKVRFLPGTSLITSIQSSSMSTYWNILGPNEWLKQGQTAPGSKVAWTSQTPPASPRRAWVSSVWSSALSGKQTCNGYLLDSTSMIFYVYVILCNISVYINIHVTCVQHAYGRLYIGRYIYIYIHVQYMLLDCILTPICFMHILPGTGDSEAWARRFRSFQRQPGTPWIHRCFFWIFPCQAPEGGNLLGIVMSTPEIAHPMFLLTWNFFRMRAEGLCYTLFSIIWITKAVQSRSNSWGAHTASTTQYICCSCSKMFYVKFCEECQELLQAAGGGTRATARWTTDCDRLRPSCDQSLVAPLLRFVWMRHPGWLPAMLSGHCIGHGGRGWSCFFRSKIS